MPRLQSEARTVGEISLLRVPAFPAVASRLLRDMASDTCGLDELADVIRTDPGLSAKLLRAANTPRAGSCGTINDIDRALLLLGFDFARRIVLTAATGAYAAASKRYQELQRCWRHSVATAVISDLLARRLGTDHGIAYTAGLMHDIGRLALVASVPDQYATLIRTAALNAQVLLDYEREALGMDHCEAGRELAERWNFPREIQVIAGRHHDPPDRSEVDSLLIVHLACRLADATGFYLVKPLRDLDIEELRRIVPAPVRERLLLDVEELAMSTGDHIASLERAGI